MNSEQYYIFNQPKSVSQEEIAAHVNSILSGSQRKKISPFCEKDVKILSNLCNDNDILSSGLESFGTKEDLIYWLTEKQILQQVRTMDLPKNEILRLLEYTKMSYPV